jgi:CheY-like chemotaxis protein
MEILLDDGNEESKNEDNYFTEQCCNKVLIVDDMPFNVKSLEMIMTHCFNISCDTAFSGQDAIDIVKQRQAKQHFSTCQPFHPLILTDINMPEMDGV